MKILLLGSGGREHALAWKIAQSPKVEKLYIAPGNAGTTAVGENVNIKATDFEAISAFALKEDIAMVVVGPEDPLVKGIYDYFQNRPELKHIAVIGPSAQGAELEGSKEFAKGFMMRHNIPTARYKSITSATIEEGLAFLETLEAPYVLKADGLCAGKGVLILPTLDEAKKELLDSVQEEVKHDKAKLIKDMEQEARDTAETKAREIISLAIQRCAADQVAETTVTVVPLPILYNRTFYYITDTARGTGVQLKYFCWTSSAVMRISLGLLPLLGPTMCMASIMSIMRAARV